MDLVQSFLKSQLGFDHPVGLGFRLPNMVGHQGSNLLQCHLVGPLTGCLMFFDLLCNLLHHGAQILDFVPNRPNGTASAVAPLWGYFGGWSYPTGHRLPKAPLSESGQAPTLALSPQCFQVDRFGVVPQHQPDDSGATPEQLDLRRFGQQAIITGPDANTVDVDASGRREPWPTIDQVEISILEDQRRLYSAD
jgi:hypothetical protein